jgi:hypothetical protein
MSDFSENVSFADWAGFSVCPKQLRHKMQIRPIPAILYEEQS